MTPPTPDQDPDAGFTALTAEQAKALRLQHPSISPWWVVRVQLLVGVLVALLAGLVVGSKTAAVSAACGAFAVVLPAAIFARGVTSRFASANAAAAVASFFVWELVKIVVTVGVLYGAYRTVTDLSWPAMLVGLVVTMKVYWLALGVKRKAVPVQDVAPGGAEN